MGFWRKFGEVAGGAMQGAGKAFQAYGLKKSVEDSNKDSLVKAVGADEDIKKKRKLNLFGDSETT